MTAGSVVSEASTDKTVNLLAQANGYEQAVDETTSAYVAASVASGLGLNMAENLNNDVELLASQQSYGASSYLTKASTVATEALTREDITEYKVDEGDTISSVAKKFHLTSDTLLWSNELTAGQALEPGQKLIILPINGVLHRVGAGDTPERLAKHYQANAAQIISFNDAEVKGLKSGQQIIIPDGRRPIDGTTAEEYSPVNSYFASSAFAPQYTGNGYSYGYCTWYSASRVNVPNNWGNATTWDDYAALSGWTVSAGPVTGAIAQNDWMAGGLGHVAIVEAVSPDGSKVKISDMNGFAGWGALGSGWAPTSQYKYIYR